MPRGQYPRVPIVAPQGGNDATDHQIGQDVPRVMKSTGPAEDALEKPYIQPVDRPVDTEKLEMLKFMEDMITIHVHTTSDPTAAQIFPVGNGGQQEIFKRGETKTVKRKFVDVLARAKATTYTQKRAQNQDGIWQDVQVPQSSLLFPFSVIQDPHPRGPDWLRYALAAAV